MSFLNPFGKTPTANAAPGILDVNRREFVGGGIAAFLTFVSCGPSPEGGLDAPRNGGIAVPTDLGAEEIRFVHKLPWTFPSYIGHFTNRILGVGTDQGGIPGQIFEFVSPDAQNSQQPIPWVSRLEIGGVRRLNYLARRAESDRYALTTDDGFYELLLGTFPSRRPLLSFPPPPAGQRNFGGGAVYAGNKLFIALSSGTVYVDDVDGEAKVAFGDVGTLIVYETGADGTLPESPTRRLRPTGGRNPTGLAMIPGTSTLLILNSGPVRNESPTSSLAFFDTSSEKIVDVIDLPSFRAQISGDIAVSDDGKFAVIGNSRSSDVLIVDLQLRRIHQRISVPGTSFHVSVRIHESRGVAYVSDFSGIVGMLDLAKFAFIKSKNLASGGPSALAGNDLIQMIREGAMRVYPVPYRPEP